MMKISIINCLGESFQLSPNPAFAVVKVSGLGPIGSNVITQKFARNGTKFINSTIDERNIVFTIRILEEVEENRDVLSHMFIPGKPVTIIFETASKKGSIVGYMENGDIDWFTLKSKASPSIICPDPLFKDDENTASGKDYTINSKSILDNDFTASVTFTSEAQSYSLRISPDTLKITYPFKIGDVLTIDTEKRKVILNGSTNLYNYKSGNWPRLHYGKNSVVSSATVNIMYTDKYISM